MKIKNLVIKNEKKHKNTGWTPQIIPEFAIRLFFFIAYPALFSTAFTGVKMIVEQIAGKNVLQWNSFVMTLVVIVIFTVLFGRFFCGFACAFGSYGDFIYFLSSKLRKKQKKKPLKVMERFSGRLKYLKYVILIVILILCARGFGSLVSIQSPFSTFSRLHALKTPESIVGMVLFLCITLGMAMEPRFFCRSLCPMGAVFSLLPVMPFSVVKRDRDNCIPGCRGCKMSCPANLDIPSRKEGDNALSGECFSCGKCMNRCPKENIRAFGGKKGWLIGLVIKATILFAIFYILY